MKANRIASTARRTNAKATSPQLDQLAAYEALVDLNRGFRDVSDALERIGARSPRRKRLPRGTLRALQLAIEETRAWASFEIIDILRDIEEEAWSRLGLLRRRAETSIQAQEPDGVQGVGRKRAGSKK